MLHINKNLKTMGRKAVRWQIMTIAFLGLFMGVFCFSGAAEATLYRIDIANAADVTEGTAAVFAVTLDTPIVAGDTVTVNYATADGFAVAGRDYTNTSGTLTFNTVGQTTQNITVPTDNDTVVENNEDFTVTLSGEAVIPTSGNNVQLITPTGSCNILDDGDQFSISVSTPQQAGEGFNVQFTVTVNNDVDLAVPVILNTTDGSATTADSDYNGGPLNWTFPFPVSAGATHIFGVLANDDPKVEADETFSVSVTSALPQWDNNPAAGNGTIINNDSATLTISGPASQAESSGNYVFTVTLDNPVQDGFTVAYTTNNGTATAGSDYTDNDGALNFAGTGGESHTITVMLMSDNVVEADETFTVALGAITPGSADASDIGTSGSPATGTIIDDDSATLTISGPVFQTEDSGGYGFTVTLDNPVQDGFNVAYTTDDGTATVAGNDYTDNDATLSFAGTAAEFHTITVAIIPDTVVEDDETFTVTLGTITPVSADPSDIGTSGSPAMGTITNDDLFAIAVNNAAVPEGDPAVFTITLGNDIDVAVSVTYDAQDGTATVVDNDYTDIPGSVTFPAGSVLNDTLSFSVDTTSDGTVEPDETFAVLVSSLDPAFNSTDSTGTGTIINNDFYSISIDDIIVNEDVGTATFTVSLDQAVNTGDTVTVDFTTVDWTATAGSDYTAATGTVTIAAGNISGTINVTINNDTIDEADEAFVINLTASSANAVRIDTQGQCTITDNDYTITPTADAGGDISPATPISVEHGTSGYTFTITPKDGFCVEDVTVNGGSVGAVTSHTFDNVTSDQTIHATFRENFRVIGDIQPFRARTLYGGNGAWRAYDTATGGTLFDSGWLDHQQNVLISDCTVTGITMEFQAQAGWETPLPQTLTLSSGETTVTGTYRPILTVVTSNGTVTSLPAGISCPGDCTEIYDSNATVQLTAVAGTGYVFSEFQGDVTVPNSPTTVVMDEPKTVTAVFIVQTGGNEDADGDGWSIDAGDCNDANNQIYPGAPEQCDSTDWDCDGLTNDTTPKDPDCEDVAIANVPLETQLQAAPANIMFVLDNSGSMDWEFITNEGDGLFESQYYIFDNPGDNAYAGAILGANQRAKWISQWSWYNKMYYNPAVEYKPWPNGDGTRFSDANLINPRSNPESSGQTLNMNNVFLSSYDGPDGFGDGCGDATLIGNGGANFNFTGRIETIGGYDYFRIDPTTGGTLTIYTAYTGDFSDTYGYLFDSGCTQLTSNDDGGDGVNFRIQRTLTAGQTYYIGVRLYNTWSATGSYDLHVEYTGNLTAHGVPVGAGTINLNPQIINAHYFTCTTFDANADGEPDDSNSDGVPDINQIYLVHMDDPAHLNYYRVTESSGLITALTLLDPVADAAEIATIAPPVRERATYADPANPTDVEIYTAERQNFVNWYSFYRRRELTAKAAVGEVIDGMKGVQVGFYTINTGLRQAVQKVRVTEDDGSGNSIYTDNTMSLLHDLYGVSSGGGTPLRPALNAVGEYYEVGGGDGGLGTPPWYSDASGDCQQAFTIVMTDGYYNGWDPGVSNIPDGDGNQTGTTDPAGNELYADTYGQTLADVAMMYYKTDLDGDATNNRVPPNFADDAEYQHMVTYGVSFGVRGTLNPDNFNLTTDQSNSDRNYPAWPDPTNGDREKIDDLWHASINGRGLFLSAGNPDELVNSLLEIMLNLTSRIGSGSSLSINGEELYAGTTMFQASYTTDGWAGDIYSYAVNTTTGEVVTGEGNAIWTASTMLGKGSDWNTVSWDTDREIATYNPDPLVEAGIKFRWTDVSVTQRAHFSDDPLTGAILENDPIKGKARLEYIRGDNTHEEQNGGSFRDRYSKLGDIVHSSPLYEGYDTDNDGVDEYGMLYVGANDGMLHAFDAGTGEEKFAYVPNLVFKDLNTLTLPEPDFRHRYFVDLTPFVKNIGTAAVPVKLLVGGLGKGGKGYYCLDVTNANIISENDLSWVKWEYPRQDSDPAEKDNMGYTFSRASIVKSYDPAHPWVVIFGNGYGSTNASSVLYILDASTGDFIRMIDTGASGNGNGLSTAVPVDINGDYRVDFVYAGDLNGNMWKFDLTDPDPTNWGSAFGDNDANSDGIINPSDGETPKPLFKTQGREKADVNSHTYTSAVTWSQPITTQPVIIRHCDHTKSGYLVIFGTGRYLAEVDADNTQYQSLYAIWDYGDEVGDYLGNFQRGNGPSGEDVFSGPLQGATTTLLQQWVQWWGPNPYNVNENLRVFTDNQPDWETYDVTERPKVDAGWYFDLPLNKERVVRDPVYRNGILIIITSRPENDPCSAGGRSIIHEIDACTGGRLDTAQFDINDDGVIDENDMISIPNPIIGEPPILVAPTGMEVDAMVFPPVILIMPDEEREVKYFITSGGGVVAVTETADQRGLFFWRYIREQ